MDMKSCGRRNVRKTWVSRTVRSTSSWKYFLSLIVWTRGKSPIQNEGMIWVYQGRGSLPLWISVPKGQIGNKRKGFTLLTLLTSILGICSIMVRIHLI